MLKRLRELNSSQEGTRKGFEIYYARTHARTHTRTQASKMDYLAEPPRRLLCWTVCAYKRPDLDDEYYHNYMSQVHGPLVKALLVKYGFVKWSMVSPGTSLLL